MQRIPTALRWTLLLTAVLAAVLVPYFLFGKSLEEWTRHYVQHPPEDRWLPAIILASLLATDILLPIPSSLVSTAAGVLYGVLWGTLISLSGMTLSCIAGYWLGASARQPLVIRLAGRDELERLERLTRRYGAWVIVAARAVPVLAEASALFAGMTGLSATRFLVFATISNAAISLVYALVGAWAVSVNAFPLAFAGAIGLSGLAFLLLRTRTRPKPDR